MVGVKGAGGPVPKRSDQRRRTNAPAKPVVKAAAVVPHVVVPMESDPDWHPVAKRWFDSLHTSGQSQFYTDSDWSMAYATAESMSREFKPQVLIVGQGKDAVVEWHEMPPKAASLAAWLKCASQLLMTEGDRRRVSLELQQPKPVEGGSGVAWIDDARRRLHGAG